MNCSVVADTPVPNLAEIYPQANNETSVLNEDNYPALDLMTAEVVRPQILSNNTNDGSKRRKRLALRAHHKSCKMTKTEISIKELNLEETILYPTSFKTVSCTGTCHKHSTQEMGNLFSCKPSDYKDIKFVFLDQNSNPRIKRVKNFLPQNCQCIKTNTF